MEALQVTSEPLAGGLWTTPPNGPIQHCRECLWPLCPGLRVGGGRGPIGSSLGHRASDAGLMPLELRVLEVTHEAADVES